MYLGPPVCQAITLLSRCYPYFAQEKMKLGENKKLSQAQTDNK